MFVVFGISLLLSSALCDVSHILIKEEITTPSPPPRPYAFGYAAGRHAGHIDRTHTEVSDGSGVVQGSYSYIDPRHQIRTVDYIADKNGFHPILNKNVQAHPSDTPVVAAAKNRHLAQYAKIAQAQAVQPGYVIVPLDTNAVAHAKNKHFSLYEKIAQDHARIAAEQKQQQILDHNVEEGFLINEHY